MADERNNNESQSAGNAKIPWADLVDMLQLRQELAEAEIKSDLRASKRFVFLGGLGLATVVTALPLLLTVVSAQIDAVYQFSFPWTACCLGLFLLFVGSLIGWTAWRRFRAEFLGLRDSIQELQEDLVWLRERFDR